MFTEHLRLILSADTGRATQQLRQFSQQTSRVGRDWDRVGGTMTRVGAGMTAVGVAAVFGLVRAAQATSNLQEAANKADVVFGSAAGRVREFAESASAIGLSERAALDAAGSFGNMFTQVGLASDQAADMSLQMTELAADFASFHNADITDVLLAQQAAFRGEYDALQRFVPTINAAAVQQQAMADTGKANADQLTAGEKALATYELMVRGAGAATGDFERTSDSAANRQRILAAEFENTKAALGAGMLPIMEQALGLASGLADGFLAVDDATGGMASRVAAYVSIGLVAAGVTSSLIGHVISARRNFQSAWSAVSGLSDRLGGFRSTAVLAGGALTALGAGLVLWQQEQAEARAENERWIDALRETEGAIEGVAREMVVDAFSDFIDGFNEAGISADDLAAALSGNEEQIRRVTQVGSELGGLGFNRLWEDATNSIADYRDQAQDVEEFTGDAAGATDDLAASADDAASSIGDETTALGDATTALQDYADQLRAQFDPVFGMTSALEGQQEAQRRVTEAQQALNDAIAENGANSTEATEAQQALTDALSATGPAALDVWQASIALNDAIAENPELLGQAISQLDVWRANGVITAQQADFLETQFREAGAAAQDAAGDYPMNLRTTNVSGVINDIYNVRAAISGIDRDIDIEVNFHTVGTPIVRRQHGGRLGHRQLAIVGEAGPELFMSDTPGRIVPNHQVAQFANLAPGPAVATAGGGTYVDQRTINVTTGADPQSVVEALIRYGRMNGAVPIRVS